MRVYPLHELIEIARTRSPFYGTLYERAGVLAGETRLERLPIVDQAEFWKANSFLDNQLLTGPLAEGVVYKSGGTTGNPKFSVFTREEWETFCEAFGRGLDRGGLRDRDRVANLFYAGGLYASFLFIGKSLEKALARSVAFPLTGASEPEAIAATVEDFGIDTLAGVPTTLLALGQCLAAGGRRLPSVRRILFGGESMYPDQRESLRRVFPGVVISSIGYASVDAGLLGFADPGCAPDEHRVFEHETVLELVDEDTGEVISEAGRAGKVLVTNLTRALMPVIRYPAGDRAMWVEDEGAECRKFRLLGRSEEAARVGPCQLYYEDLREVLQGPGLPAGVGGFQLVLTHAESKDRLQIRIAVPEPARVSVAEREAFAARLDEARPFLAEAERDGKIHPVAVEWVGASGLTVNVRTGKLRRVVDLRQG